MIEEEKKENQPLTEEQLLQQKKEKEKKLLSASPGAVDSSSIDVNASTVKEIASESNVVSETVVDTNANDIVFEKEQEQNQTLQEVSVTVDANSLEVNPDETAEGSIFNKKEEVVKEEPTKLGEDTSKKRFPFFMVLFFIILIVIAFNIDKVSMIIKDYLTSKEPVVTEEKKQTTVEIKTITLVELKDALTKSNYISNFETNNNIKVQISTDEEKELSISTTDYLNIGVNPLAVEYKLDSNVLSATCDSKISSYCNEINNFVIIEVLKLRGDTNTNVLDDVKSTITTATIEQNGFSMTVGDTNTVSYSISLDKELVYNKTDSTTNNTEEENNNEGSESNEGQGTDNNNSSNENKSLEENNTNQGTENNSNN